MNKKKEEKKVIALTWGYTWGHVFPLLSLYEYLKEEDNNYEYVWVWEEDSLENEVANKNNIKFLHIPAGKIRRYFDWRNFYEPLKNLSWVFFWINYIIKYKIDIVFSKWWYVALPLCIAAFIMRKKIYIHESDMVSWVANNFIWKIATKIFYTFPNEKTESWDPKYILSWQILNPELLDWIKDLDIEENEFLSVLVIWGSQWSTTIFEAMLEVIPELPEIDFQVVLWEKNTHFKNEFEKFDNVKTYDFVSQKKLWEIYKKIDIAVTRWWATTLWELALFWIHSIIVPLEWSAWNHQEENANYFNKNYWSDVVKQNNLDEKLLLKLKGYSNLRKSWLNLWWFFNALKIIDSEIS